MQKEFKKEHYQIQEAWKTYKEAEIQKQHKNQKEKKEFTRPER